MARILKEKGEEVALLALIETVAVPPGLSNWKYYLHRLACTVRMRPKRFWLYAREKLQYYRDSRLARRMRFRALVESELASENEESGHKLKRLERVYNINLRALRQYHSRFYPGKVTLFNAAEADPALIPDPQYGWVGLAQEIETHLTPGDHNTMLSEPRVRVLAEKLKKCAQEAREQSGNRSRL
jgi:thioesterase domain-containing protein